VKRVVQLAAVTAAAALVLSACGDAPEDDATSGAAAEGGSDFKACMVSDQGGFDDKSFNESGFNGLAAARDALGIEVATQESQNESDFAPNIDNLITGNCNIIITVGYLLGTATGDAATANPDTEFAIVDSTAADADGAPIELPNVKPLSFNTAEAAYLAGYVAAGMTETGTVATYGGVAIPTVSIFMDGFVDGVAKYNEDNGTDVKTLGWDKEAQNGSFTGDFENQTNGQNLAKGFIDQGADVIMPVAGPVGLGAATAIEAGGATMIWVDSDGFNSTDYGDIIATSVMKEIGQAVFDSISEASTGNFDATPYVGTLENEGVGLADFHDFADSVPQELQDKIAEYRDQIIAGDLVVETTNAP